MAIEDISKKQQHKLVWSADTDIGPVRKENEDSFVVVEPSTFVIADGMGGYAAGEVASRILTDTAKEQLTGEANITELSLKQVITQANRIVVEEAGKSQDKQGMGTTATLCHIEGDTVYWAHVGDSKLYHLHAGKLNQITKDHTYANLLVDRGEATPADAAKNASANMLTRAIGVDNVVFADTGSFNIENGDKLVLCTDGLSGALSESAMCDLLNDSASEAEAKTLVRAALNFGSRDNVTAIVVTVAGYC
ncbi:MAG: protein phosphatase 2C domain-containing protein [Selenomonadaceae bacterium]|nr:protein phosphatase 2C domain-containing protein [Selenomonadaceae bacterium]